MQDLSSTTYLKPISTRRSSFTRYSAERPSPPKQSTRKKENENTVMVLLHGHEIGLCLPSWLPPFSNLPAIFV